jgi:glycosyltransferase involved in cell wall biosynthesis
MSINTKKMCIGFVMPDLALFGGPKRVVTICNMLRKRGYKVKLYLDPRFQRLPFWTTDILFEIAPYNDLRHDQNHIVFFLNPRFIDMEYIKNSKAKYDVIYIVANGGITKKYYDKWIDNFRNNPKVLLAGNNGLWRYNYNINGYRCFDLIGGIDLEQYYRVDVRKNPKYFNILVQGRISRQWKGTEEIIKTIENMENKKNINLIIFNAEQVDIKTSLKTEMKISVHPKRMKEVYSQGDLYVHFEDNTSGWSNTCAEAMACKIPVVCTKYGTSDFAVHNETAFVIERNEKELGKAIETMMRDDRLRDKIAAGGHEKIKQFTWARLTDDIENMIMAV